MNEVINLVRFVKSSGFTISKLSYIGVKASTGFRCVVLELPYKGNLKRISCIPAGEYLCTIHESPRFGKVYKVHNVVNRSEILIHKGNTVNDTKGCLLVGSSYAVSNDGTVAVIHESKKAFSGLLGLGLTQFTLIIREVC